MNSKPVNVLFISHSGLWGGAQKSLLALVNYIDNKKIYKPHFIFGSKGDFLDFISNRGYKTFNIILLRWSAYNFGLKNILWFFYNFLFGTFFICRVIKKNKIRIVHTNTIFNFQGAIAAKIMNVKHIWHIREDLSLPYFKFLIPYKSIVKIINILSDKIICISEIEKRLFKNSKKIKVVYNTWQINPNTIHNKTNYNKNADIDKVLFGQFGFIFPNKNQKWCVESFIELCKEKDNCELVIIGKIVDQDYYNKLMDLIIDSGIEDKIKFIPFTDDVASWYKKIDVLLNPMLRGIVGRVTIEAMSFGIPCIGNSGDIDQSLFRNDVNGFLVDFNDKEAMKNSMLKLTNPTLRSKFGDASFKKSNEALSNSIYGGSVSDIYMNLLSNSYYHD